MAEAKKIAVSKVRTWALETVNSRLLPGRLNELSATGHVVFGVHQSTGIGGAYEVLSYIEK